MGDLSCVYVHCAVEVETCLHRDELDGGLRRRQEQQRRDVKGDDECVWLSGSGG
jgi:hypothetical protein